MTITQLPAEFVLVGTRPEAVVPRRLFAWLAGRRDRDCRADVAARAVGLPSRYALARCLRKHGLPPFRELVQWCSLLTWITCADQHGTSLCKQAFEAGDNPARRYRLVRRLTGSGWRDLSGRGPSHVLELFRARCVDCGERASTNPLALTPNRTKQHTHQVA